MKPEITIDKESCGTPQKKTPKADPDVTKALLKKTTQSKMADLSMTPSKKDSIVKNRTPAKKDQKN